MSIQATCLRQENGLKLSSLENIKDCPGSRQEMNCNRIKESWVKYLPNVQNDLDYHLNLRTELSGKGITWISYWASDQIRTSRNKSTCTFKFFVGEGATFVVFRWFKFTLKPPYSITHGRLQLAIWDTSFRTFWLKFGHKGPWDIS